MRLIRPTILAVLLLAGPFASASAITVDDLVNLRANGLGDDILVALIEADGSAFQLSSDEVIALRKRGLSERVILAMLVTGTKVAAAPTSPVPNPAPVVHVTQTVVQTVERVEREIIAVPVAIPVVVERRRPEEKKPVYWGFGGRPRPGSWIDTEK